MSTEVQFHDDKTKPVYAIQGKTGLTEWLINKGIARDKKQSETLILFFGIVCIVISIALFMLLSGDAEIVPLSEPATT